MFYWLQRCVTTKWEWDKEGMGQGGNGTRREWDKEGMGRGVEDKGQFFFNSQYTSLFKLATMNL